MGRDDTPLARIARPRRDGFRANTRSKEATCWPACTARSHGSGIAAPGSSCTAIPKLRQISARVTFGPRINGHTVYGMQH
jgi:hypothetical protein